MKMPKKCITSLFFTLILILGTSFVFTTSANGDLLSASGYSSPPIRKAEEIFPGLYSLDFPFKGSTLTSSFYNAEYGVTEIYLHNISDMESPSFEELKAIGGLNHYGLAVNPYSPYNVEMVRINYGRWLTEEEFSNMYKGLDFSIFQRRVDLDVKIDAHFKDYYPQLKAHYEYLEWEYPANYPDPYIPLFVHE